MCPFCWIRACNHSLVVVLNWSHKHLMSNPNPFSFGRSSRFDVLLVWTWALGPPYRSINGIQGFAQASFGSLFCWKNEMMYEPVPVLLLTAWSFQNLHKSFFLHNYFHLHKIPQIQKHWSIPTATYCRDCSLGCKPLPSFSKHKQRLSGHNSSMHDL